VRRCEGTSNNKNVVERRAVRLDGDMRLRMAGWRFTLNRKIFIVWYPALAGWRFTFLLFGIRR
jgi:hypothetical protein